MQNLAAAGATVPQAGHRRSSAPPHDMQNFASAGLAVPQLLQVLSMALDRVYARPSIAPQ
jgi:hypothetical protein